jgi:hypothetical protein
MSKINQFFTNLLLAGLLATLGVAPSVAGPLVVENYADGETLRYPLVLLRGTQADLAASHVVLRNSSSRLASRLMTGNAYQGRFKVLAELVPGENRLILQAGAETRDLVLNYRPQTNPYRIRAIHFTDNSGDPTYDTPFAHDTDYRAKWDAALKLLQTFTADEMRRHGHGRKTFNLELDAQGQVIVHIVKARGNFAELQKMGGGETYEAAATAIAGQLPKGPFKDLVCVAFSRHVKETGLATAYAALGGGNTALMGGACFFTWPTGVTNIQATFMSNVPIDDRLFHADDADRFAVWATASTTIGAGLHELGHTLTLPHTKLYPNGIMRRGGDSLNRYLGFLDPPCRRHQDYREFKSDGEPCWSDVCAAALAPSRWLALDARDWTKNNTIRFALDPATAELVVRSDAGLAFAGVEIPGSAEKFNPGASLATLPQQLRFPLAALAREYRTSQLTVRAMDGMGHYRHTSLEGLLHLERNLTTGKPVRASQDESSDFPAAAAVDGDMYSYWDAHPQPQWLQVDLEKVVTIDEVHLYGYADEGRHYQYTIACSRDGKTWSQVVDASANVAPSTQTGYRHVIPATPTRYVRVNMLRNSRNPGVHICELRVFEPGAPRSQAAYGTLEKLFAPENAR